MSTSRRGFTLLELMVVMAIMAVLAGMILAILSILKKAKTRALTMSEMQDITTVMEFYLDQWPRLGDNVGLEKSDDFKANPWDYLYVRRLRDKKVPYLEGISLGNLVQKTGPNACAIVSMKVEATHIVDFFGVTPNNVLMWDITNKAAKGGTGNGFDYSDIIRLRSSAGSPNVVTDDIVYERRAENSRWDIIKALPTDIWSPPLLP
jgi:prepilin-type N-terminal cleavage/methylation domain-containing protein